jgi:molecular chaperone HtpG
VIRRIRGSLVKGVLDRLDRLATDDAKAFETFSQQFGTMLREGVITDFANRERLAKLLRFASSRSEASEARVSLDDYLARMPAEQKRIYYLGGPDPASIAKSPNLEIFRRRGIEVLFLTEPIDEFALNALGSYEGKALTSIDSADLDLPPETPAEAEASKTDAASASESSRTGFGRVLDLFRAALAGKVQDVRESNRLTDSPCCLVNAEGGLSTQMQRLLKMANQEIPDSGKILEVNPKAPLVQRLGRLAANPDHDGFIKQCALQLWSNAMVLDGSLPDPEEMVKRVQTFMAEAAEQRSPLILG